MVRKPRFFPQVAWLTLSGTWRLRYMGGKKYALMSQRPYVAVPEGMEPDEAYRRLHGEAENEDDGELEKSSAKLVC